MSLVWLPKHSNSWINLACTDLQTATDFYGKSICISALGDTSSVVGVSSIQSKTSSANGPTVVRLAPPEDAKVAEGTTLNCGRWHIVTKSDTCKDICKAYDICVGNIMYEINPSLPGRAECTASLIPGVALCVAPISGWNVTYEPTGRV